MRRGTRIRIALAVSAGLGLAPLLAAAPAAAQVCTPAPACLTDSVEGAVEDAGEAVRDTSAEVRDTVDETVGGVTGTVDDVLNPGGGDDPGLSLIHI